MRLVEKLQSLIAERGLTQSAFEPMVGLPTNRISKWAGGQGEPTARQALRMARLLKVPVEWLVDDEMRTEPPIPTTDREADLWKVVRTIGLDEAWRRLVQAPMASSDQVEYSTGEDVIQRKDARKGRAG